MHIDNPLLVPEHGPVDMGPRRVPEGDDAVRRDIGWGRAGSTSVRVCTMTSLADFEPSAPMDLLHEVFRENGCLVVRDLALGETEQALGELAPYIAAALLGDGEFPGRRTRRLGSVLARSPAARELFAGACRHGSRREDVHALHAELAAQFLRYHAPRTRGRCPGTAP